MIAGTPAAHGFGVDLLRRDTSVIPASGRLGSPKEINSDASKALEGNPGGAARLADKARSPGSSKLLRDTA